MAPSPQPSCSNQLHASYSSSKSRTTSPAIVNTIVPNKYRCSQCTIFLSFFTSIRKGNVRFWAKHFAPCLSLYGMLPAHLTHTGCSVTICVNQLFFSWMGILDASLCQIKQRDAAEKRLSLDATTPHDLKRYSRGR